MQQKTIFYCFLLFLSVGVLSSCGKKEEETTFVPPNQEFSSDKEKELKEKEEFLRLKEEQLKNENMTRDSSAPVKTDSVVAKEKKDSVTKVTETQTPKTKEKKELVKKETDLNKRLDNPKGAIDDYLEYIKRGIGEEGNFDKNMGSASQLWVGRSKDKFKTAYKNTKQFVVVSEPEVVSQKGNTAKVKVKIKQTDKSGGKDKQTEMTVTYNLVADSKGKWKIQNNSVKKN